MNFFIESAKVFCLAAHAAAGQRRKYTGEPYHLHPFEVADTVAGTEYCTEEMIVAALLHDVVEDTEVSLDVIARQFGLIATAYVEQLTDVSVLGDGNRAARKAIDLAHTAKASPQAKTIKLADLISNSRSIIKHDPEFAKVYLTEKRALLKVLTEGDHTLYKIAYDIAHGAQ
jgi:(p)ppGpp synthase/HD superfamily hydrolase